MAPSPGQLYIVATPIGNLDDLTARAGQCLADVDVIAAEDTRRTKNLCNHLGITQPNLIRCDEAMESHMTASLIDRLLQGQSIALVSDAGTPCISDPGWRLVQAARQADVIVTPVCGASSITAALSVSGFPATPFTFMGFLEKKKTRSQTQLQTMLDCVHTSVFFESPYRIEKTMAQLVDLAPHRKIFMIREISKKFEQAYYGTPPQILASLSTTKGEWTVVISPNHGKFMEEAS